jgi:hypothetical protein
MRDLYTPCVWVLVGLTVVVIGFNLFSDLTSLVARLGQREPVVNTTGCAAPRLDSQLDNRSVYHVTDCRGGVEYWIIRIEPTPIVEKPNGRRVQTNARRQG